MRHVGNIEPYLSYSKLHRTGRLLRGLKSRVVGEGTSLAIELYNKVPYAQQHEKGGVTSRVEINEPYTTNGAKGVITGGNVVARPHMQPSKQVLKAPRNLIGTKMKSFGW